MKRNLQELKAWYVERSEALAHRVSQLREIRGEGNLYMADVLEEKKLILDQRVYEINLALN